MADQILESIGCEPIGSEGPCTGGGSAGNAKWESWNENSALTLNHTRNVSFAAKVSSIYIDLHKSTRTFKLDGFMKPPVVKTHPTQILAVPPYVYKADGSVDWLASSYVDGIFGNHAADKYLCDMVNDSINVTDPSSSITASEDYTVVDSYLHTLDIDNGLALFRETTYSVTFSGTSQKVLIDISFYGPAPPFNQIARLNPHAAVQVTPTHTITDKLYLISVHGKTLLDTQTRTFVKQNIILSTNPYYGKENFLSTDEINGTMDDPAEQAKIKTAYNASLMKGIIRLDWDFSSLIYNYYFKVNPIMSPGDKESIDGSLRDEGDFFYPKWLKSSGRQNFFTADANARAGLDYDHKEPKPSDEARSKRNVVTEISANWFSNDGSYAQAMQKPTKKEVLYSCYDAAFAKYYNGYIAEDGKHTPIVYQNGTMLPISCSFDPEDGVEVKA